MAYPPTVPSNSRTNVTPQQTNHPGDHNTIADALQDIINELGSNPSGGEATVQARIAAAEAATTALSTGVLLKSGGTMTGALTLAGAPSSNLHAATKVYVDGVFAGKLVANGRGGMWRRASTYQSITSGVETDITMDSEDVDGPGLGTATSSSFTVPAGWGGWWLANGVIKYQTDTTSAIAILKTSTLAEVWWAAAGTANVSLALAVTGLAYVAEGEVWRIATYHSAGVARNVNARLSLNWLGA